MLGAVAAGVFVMALAGVVALERRAARLGLIDHPNNRSSHVAARPRGGGAAIVVSVVVGAAVVAMGGVRFDVTTWTILGGAMIVATAGLWDDLRSIEPAPRFVAQVMAASIVVVAAGGLARLPLPPPFDLSLGALGFVLAVVWIVGVTNFFNFMDGADGLAGGQASLTFAALALVLWPEASALVPVLAIAATAAFLCRNWAPARVFLGDVGSGWLGFMLAAWPFAGPIGRRGDLVLLVATSLALFLLDPATTLVRRWRHGGRLTTSHREHAYQRLFVPGQSHACVVILMLAAAASLSAAGAAAYWRPAWAWPAIGWAACLFVAEWVAADRIGRRRPVGRMTGPGQPGAGT